MSGWEGFWGAATALVGAAIGAGSTIWATKRTLREQARLVAEERAAAVEGEFEFAKRRADQQMVSAVTALRITRLPQVPYITLDHDALDAMLRFPQVPEQVGFELVRITMALRRYNAAAELGNAKFPLSGAGGPSEERWQEAQGLADVAWRTYRAWRGDDVAKLHPLADD